MRWLRNILALMPCGKPQADYLAHVTALLQRLSARTHARWFARPFPFARLAVAALGALRPRPVGELLIVDASFVPKSGRGTWGVGWLGSGMARAARRSLEVSLRAAVDIAEGGAYPLCARQAPGTGLSLLREAVAAGARDTLQARWVVANGRPGTRTFVEWMRALGLHTVGRLRKDAVLCFRYTGPHARRPGRKRQFDGRFDRRDLARMARTTPTDAQVALYHAELQGKAWQR